MHRMSLTATTAAAAAALLLASAPATAQTDFALHILHHNDGESQLLGTGPANQYGGVARFATRIAQLRTDALTLPAGPFDRGSILVTSGDNFLAGPEFNASIQNGTPYFDAIALDLIGYDAFAIGNHEFDFGPQILANFINSFSGPATFLSANLDFSAEPALQPLVDNGSIAPSTLLNVNGRLVGLIGLTTTTLPFVSSPGGVVVDTDLVSAVNTEINALQGLGANIIILTTHLQNINGEIDLIAQLSDVDVVIAGGGGELLANPDDALVPGDTALNTYPVIATDLDGKQVPIVTTSGDYKYIGRLVVGFDLNGEVTEIFDESGAVRVSGNPADADFVDADPAVQAQVVDPVAAAVQALADNIIAFSDVPLDGVRARIRTEETNLGNLAADSLLWAAAVVGPQFGAPTPDVAIQNGGGIRNDSVIPAGPISELDTFDILPFSNFATVVPQVDAQTFKQIMENTVSRVEFVDGRFAQIAGFRVEWDPTGIAQVISGDQITVPGSRIKSIVLNDGREIVRDYLVVANAEPINIAIVDFLARGGDQYPFFGAPFTIVGVSYQQALRDFITDALSGEITALDYRDGGEGRIIEIAEGDLASCPGDLNADGTVDSTDLGILLAAFGAAAQGLNADINDDNLVDSNDLTILLSHFATNCN
ncbi:MAG: 5'-nucleotidase C-terminal domain-containing protein [Phycisphaerales bacterium]